MLRSYKGKQDDILTAVSVGIFLFRHHLTKRFRGTKLAEAPEWLEDLKATPIYTKQ